MIIFKTLLLIFFSLQAFAQNHNNCEHDHHPELKAFFGIKDALVRIPATDEQINKAHCFRKVPFSNKEMTDWISGNESNLKINESVHGINFENESIDTIEAFKKLTTAKDFLLGSLAPERQKTFSSQCKKVTCAVKEIFGNDVGLQLLFMQKKYGMNGSHIIYDDTEATPWTKEELDISLMAFSDFPEGVFPVEESRKFIHAPRNEVRGTVSANALVKIYQHWNSKTPTNRRAIIFHELSHVMAGVTNLDNSETWMSQSGWSSRKKIIADTEVEIVDISRPETIISDYGMANRWEDLAESAMAYRYNPELLKKASPSKYELLKKTLFDNVDYSSEESCQNPKRLSEDVQKEVKNDLQSWAPSDEEFKLISQACTTKVFKILTLENKANLASPEIKHCYEQALANLLKSKLKDKILTYPHGEHLSPMIRNINIELPLENKGLILTQTSDFHRNELRSLIKQSVDSQNCSTPQYAYMSYDENRLGVSGYSLRNELETISGRFCREKSKKDRYQLIEKMIP